MRIITNRFKTKCSGTLRVILPGELILLDQKKAYSIHSKEFKQFQEQQNEGQSIKHYIEAQKNAYFDRFCNLNNI